MSALHWVAINDHIRCAESLIKAGVALTRTLAQALTRTLAQALTRTLAQALTQTLALTT